jgi:hypothetical protein
MMMMRMMIMIFIMLKITFQSNYVAKVMLAWREHFGIMFQSLNISKVYTCIQIKTLRSCLNWLNWLSTMQSISYRTYVWQFRDVTFFVWNHPACCDRYLILVYIVRMWEGTVPSLSIFCLLPPFPIRCGQSLLHFRPTCWLIALEFQDYLAFSSRQFTCWKSRRALATVIP